MNINWRLVAAGGVLALLFVAVAVAMRLGLFRHFDRTMLAILRSPDVRHTLLGPPWLLKMVIGVTTLGAGAVRTPVAIAAALVLALRQRGREAAMLAFAVTSGAIALPVLKLLFDRPRPDLLWHLVNETTWSFPSGHAMGAMILYPLLGYIAGYGRGTTRAGGLAVAGVLLTLLIGMTRIVLGVHWASDVIGGWLIGGAFALVTVGLFRRPKRPLDQQVAAASA
jgi:undecaprenyl-diphosphatase